ncbi:hypothetical protein BH09MYX1_BH09MYX1_34280 [soil metagenome]
MAEGERKRLVQRMVTMVRLKRGVLFAFLCLVPTGALAGDDDDLVVSAKPSASVSASASAASSAAPLGAPVVAPAPPPTTPTTPTSAAADPGAKKLWGILPALESITKHMDLTGFAQVDLHGSQASEPEVQQGGALLNENRFLVRAARPRLDVDYTYAKLQLELDANTARGPEIRLFHAYGTAVLPGRKEGDPPIAAFSMGLMDTPFGYEVGLLPQRQQMFAERSLASRAFFPGIPDVGMRFFGGLSFVRWSVGLMNGQPIDTAQALRAPMSPRDVSFRLGVVTHPLESLEIRGGVSGLRGKGFHPGTEATKNSISWVDVNEDGAIQPSELVALPATAAAPSVLYDRWMVGADLQAMLKTKLGLTQLAGELYVASNYDRNFQVSDPVLLGQDTRQLGAYASLVQDLGRFFVIGFRWDLYDPNLDAFASRAGKLVPNKQTVMTFSPMVGIVLPGRARLVFEYDFIRDGLARDSRGLPTDLANDAFNLRMQVDL